MMILREKHSMRQILNSCGLAAALCALVLTTSARADLQVESFDNFASDELYGSWLSSTPVSGPTSYGITATGYGSNYEFIGYKGLAGEGYTTVEFTVTLSGPPEADGQLGPLLQLVDGDGSRYHYRWYGQLLGSHTLTMDIATPTVAQENPFSTAGLNLNDLQHMHMELDPGGLGIAGAYTVVWEDLRFTNFVPEPSSFLLLGTCGIFLGLRRRK
jgi:hypothetical protein